MTGYPDDVKIARMVVVSRFIKEVPPFLSRGIFSSPTEFAVVGDLLNHTVAVYVNLEILSPEAASGL